MKKKVNFANLLKEVQPLKQSTTGLMTGGFTPFGGVDSLRQQTVQTSIMNEVLVGVLGYACSCSCQCAC